MNVTNLWFALLNGYSDGPLYRLLQVIRKKYLDDYSGSHCTVPLPGKPTMRRLVILLQAVAKQQRTVEIGIITCELIHRLVACDDALQEFVVRGLPEALLLVIRSLTDVTQGNMMDKPTMSMHFKLLEAATKLLLRLSAATRRNSATLDVMLTENAAIAMLNVIDCEKSFVFQYSPEASQHLETLTLGKTLIGKRVRLDTGVLRNKYRQYFGDNQDKVSVPSLGYVVTLFDTTIPDKDVMISNEMLDSKLVWPEDESESAVVHPDDDWVDVSVQCAFGGSSFWARFPTDESVAQMNAVNATLEEFFAKNDLQTLKHAPMVGAFVCGHKPGIGVYRGQVVSTDSTTATVFAFDYGSLFVEPWETLVCITRELDLKVEPQAMLCKLQGVFPAAYSVGLVADAIAILCNLSAHVKATMLKMPRCACLVPLCWCPHPQLAVRTLHFLSNLAWDPCQRVFLAAPFIKVVITICVRLTDRLREPEMSAVVEAALALLSNLIYDCPENIHKLRKMDGLKVLLSLSIDSTPFAVREAALKVMRSYVGDGPPPVNAPGTRRRPWHGGRGSQRNCESDSEGNPRRVSRPSHRDIRTSPDSDGDAPWRRHSQHRTHSGSRGRSTSRTRHGSDSTVRAIARIDLQDSSSDDGVQDGKLRESDSILASMPAASEQSEEGPEKTQYVNMTALRSSETQYSIRDEAVDITDDETHEIRRNGRLEDVSSSSIANIVCSFLNSGEGGTIYFGLRKTVGTAGVRVCGIRASRDQRDCFRMGVDKDVIGNIMPIVTATYYNIVFNQVILPEPTSEQATVLPDLYVIELRVKPVVGSAYVSKENKYFVREGDKSVCLHSQQKIHEYLIRKHEERYLEEMLGLSLELEHLQKLVASRSSANQSPKPGTSHGACFTGNSRVEE